MLGSASRDFHRWRTNEMLIATCKMAEKRKYSKTMERAATANVEFEEYDLEFDTFFLDPEKSKDSE